MIEIQDATTRQGGSTDRGRLPYFPAIDGLRTLALAAVLLDHGGVGSVVGGHFGVTVFFVLSGFLVTGLLLQERERTGGIHLAGFWARRARRLVPASLVFVGFTLAYLAWSPSRPPSTVVGDGIASLAWVANWRFVVTERSYGDLFADPTPFAHLWSLAVEEQFYLVLPVVASILLGRRAGAPGRRGLFGAVLVGVIVASTVVAWRSYGADQDSIRAYYGTDARMAELAVGSLLAVLLVRARGVVELATRWRAATSVAAGVAAVAVAWLVHEVTAQDAFNYRGGLLLVALLSAVVVVAATQPGSAVARVLSVEPLPQLGRLTYGAYLFHWPIFLWCDERTLGIGGAGLLLVRLVLTFSAAGASYVLVERPFRLGHLPQRVGGMAWANASVGLVAVLAVVAASTGPSSSFVVSSADGPVPPVPAQPGAAVPAPAPSPDSGEAPPEDALAPSGGPAVVPGSEPGTGSDPATGPTPPPAPAPTGQQPPAGGTVPTTVPAPIALKVAVVGDSLGDDLAKGLLAWADGGQDISIYNLTIPGCPLSRGGTRRFGNGNDFPIPKVCAWWDDPADQRRQQLFAFDPDIVLVEDALNEVVDRKLPAWEGYRHVGDPRFDVWLLAEYRRAAEVFSSQGATVVYADAPCADWQRMANWSSIDDLDGRVAALNRIYDSVVAATTKVADLHQRLCPGGEYSDTVEGVPNGRPDGFHLAPEASRRLAERWTAPFLRKVAGA